MIRFRGKRAQDFFDGLCDRDTARLRAFMAQAQPTPGLGNIAAGEGSRDGSASERRGSATATHPPETPKRKRGRRA